ncbi:hypothetical protein IMSAGC013_03863 [Lachnospiraceae bacterium]|nr:hypothetical protein IMSAGC013_03863 [Lachnospiraceae bacterium]
MLVIEAENSDMESYLKVIIEHLKSNLCQEMNLSELNNIKAVDSSKLPRNVDARSEGDTIFLSIQSIQQAMKNVNLSELESHLKKDIEEMQCEVVNILNNLYHEICHMNERTISPILHNIIADENHYTILEKLVAHYWIEFVVECKSGEQHFRSEVEFCDSFIATKWNIQYIKGNRDDIKDLYWLMYSTPYFIALCFINNCFDYYCGKIIDEQIAVLVQKLYAVCTDLYKEESFDNYDKIKVIGEIFEEAFNTKSKNYEALYL